MLDVLAINTMVALYSNIDDKGGVLYIESPFGSCGLNDLNPVEYGTDGMSINNLITKYKVFKSEVEK